MFTLMIATQFGLLTPAMRDSKLVSPCANSGERFAIEYLERNGAAPKTSGRCKREDQLRRLIRALYESGE
jgi:hypothetical protein